MAFSASNAPSLAEGCGLADTQRARDEKENGCRTADSKKDQSGPANDVAQEDLATISIGQFTYMASFAWKSA